MLPGGPSAIEVSARPGSLGAGQRHSDAQPQGHAAGCAGCGLAPQLQPEKKHPQKPGFWGMKPLIWDILGPDHGGVLVFRDVPSPFTLW